MDAIFQVINEALNEKLKLIDFLREENRSVTARLRGAEELIEKQASKIIELEKKIAEMEDDF